MAKEENRPRRRTTIHDIPHDTLGAILQRITCLAVLVRAAATCKLWRLVVGDAGFLCRFRRLYGPYVLGHHFYDDFGGSTEFVPFPAPAGEMGIGGISSDRVSLDFLRPRSGPDLVLHDSHGGLLALSDIAGSMITICNPWTREHMRFNSPNPTTPARGFTAILGAFLLDTDLDLGAMAVGDIIPPPFLLVGRAGGSICWCTEKTSNVILHLDESSGEFSRFTLPGGHADGYYDRMNLRVVGGGAGAVHFVRIVRGDLEVLRYARGGGRECVVERRVNVSQVASIDGDWRRWYFSDDTSAEAASPGRILLFDHTCDYEFVCRLSAHRQDIQLEHVAVQKFSGHRRQLVAFPYELPWTINACMQDEAIMETANVVG
ncbi:unnamed protein product [Urochloa decumbens]|uniref:F-box domain-containing protein n=1 Tax=Urochloa decumbens TaxID=240449 RepID=A0ABC8WAA0_9POAL